MDKASWLFLYYASWVHRLGQQPTCSMLHLFQRSCGGEIGSVMSVLSSVVEGVVHTVFGFLIFVLFLLIFFV